MNSWNFKVLFQNFDTRVRLFVLSRQFGKVFIITTAEENTGGTSFLLCSMNKVATHDGKLYAD